jgi:hypothetical protein
MPCVSASSIVFSRMARMAADIGNPEAEAESMSNSAATRFG